MDYFIFYAFIVFFFAFLGLKIYANIKGESSIFYLKLKRKKDNVSIAKRSKYTINNLLSYNEKKLFLDISILIAEHGYFIFPKIGINLLLDSESKEAKSFLNKNNAIDYLIVDCEFNVICAIDYMKSNNETNIDLNSIRAKSIAFNLAGVAFVLINEEEEAEGINHLKEALKFVKEIS